MHITKNRNNLLALLITLALVTGLISFSSTAKAEVVENQVIGTYEGYVNQVKRTLLLISDKDDINVWFKVGDTEFKEVWTYGRAAGPSIYGATALISDEKDLLLWSYDLDPNFDSMSFLICDTDVESLIFQGSGNGAIVIGYKKLSGEICSLPTFDEVKNRMGVESSIPAPSYVPISDATTTPTPTPTQAITPTPIPKSTPTPTSKPRPTKKPVVKKPVAKVSKTKAAIYNSKGKLTSKLTLKNGTLTWKKGTKKARTYKKVTCVGVVEKSKNIYFMNKKKEIWRVSFKTGKKKLFLRKGKKFVYKKNKNQNYLVQIKTASKKVNMKNR